jgi:signal peptidase I
MIAAGKRTILNGGQTVVFGDDNLEVVNKFVYLGAFVTPKNDVGLEVQRRTKLEIGRYLRPAKTSAVISPDTSDKNNDLQDLDPPGPAVWQ